MSDCLEVLFVGDNSDKLNGVNCFNPYVGTTLMSYKGSGALKNCVSLIGNDYLISASSQKPILQVWPLNSQKPAQELRMVIAGKPSALSVSPNGHYCIAAIDSKIYTWQISSGNLLSVISKHYQEIVKIVFMDDSSHFVTAGEDGLVFVWKLSDVVARSFFNFKVGCNEVMPVFSFSHHSLPVTDIFLGSGNLKSRLFTVSSDRSCKIYNCSDGQLLLSIVFEHVLSAVTVNELETDLFVGTNSGVIQIFHLEPYPRNLENYVSNQTDSINTLSGHSKAVTCLSISLNGCTLASGSDDEKVFLWNIPSRQLIRSIEMKGPITNMFFSLPSTNIFSNKLKPQLVVSKFEKTSGADAEIQVWVHQEIKPLSLVDEFYGDETNNEHDISHFSNSKVDEEEMNALKDQIVKLKEINQQLYEFAMNEIIKNPLTIGLGEASDNYKNKNLENLMEA